MAYSRRRAGARRTRSAAPRARGRVSRPRASRARAGRSGQTVKLVIQTVPYGGADPFQTAVAPKRAAKH